MPEPHTPKICVPWKTPVLGVGISATNYHNVLQLCRGWIDDKREWDVRPSDRKKAPAGRCIFALAVNAVMTGVLQPRFRELLNAADIAATDGMPLAWAARSFGERKQPRVYGPDLMLALCGQAARLKHRVALLGGREEVVPQLKRCLERRFPGLLVVASLPRRDPPQTRQEDEALTETIRQSGADLVFVGFGQPRQETWIIEHRDRLPGVVMVGVGAAFDFHAGRVAQAPRWMQNAGLEWFFRLLIEPRRLWRRYVLFNPLFLAMWAMQFVGLLHYPKVSRT